MNSVHLKEFKIIYPRINHSAKNLSFVKMESELSWWTRIKSWSGFKQEILQCTVRRQGPNSRVFLDVEHCPWCRVLAECWMLCEIFFSVNLRGSWELRTNPPTQCSITFLNNYSAGQQWEVASLGQIRGGARADRPGWGWHKPDKVDTKLISGYFYFQTIYRDPDILSIHKTRSEESF